MKSDCLNKQFLIFGLFLAGYLFFSALLSGIYFLIGSSINKTILPLSIILAYVACKICFSRQKTLRPVLSGILFIAIAAAINIFIYDSTFDSIGYHCDIAVMMADGWNPIYEEPWNGSIWAKHYVKIIETIGASILVITGNVQSIKSVNFILWGSTLSIAWYTLSEILPNVSWKWRSAIVFIIASNPVVIRQIVSMYNDYAIWLETVLLFCSFAMMWKKPDRLASYALLFFTFSFAINSKFTHFFYSGLECLFFAVWCLIFKRYCILWKGVITVIAALVAGVLIIGYNPYVLNTVGYGIPTYPLGTDTVDIMTGNTPDMYAEDNRFVNFFKSLLSLEDSPWAIATGNFSLSGIRNCYASSMTVNGFGIFMAPMLLLGLALMALSRAKLKWWIIYLFMFMLSFCFEQSWWARYIPFLWFGIVFPVIISFTYNKQHVRLRKYLRYAILILCFVNAAISLSATILARLSYTEYINYIVATQHQIKTPLNVAGLNITMTQQLKERDVDFIEYPTPESLPETDNLFRFFGTNSFDAVIELPAADYPRAYKTPSSFIDKLIRFDERRYILAQESIPQ